MEYLERSSLLTGKVEMIEIVRIVNSVFESNTYLAISRNYGLCFLIDCGDPIPIIENISMGHRTKRFFQWSGKMGERL